MRDRVFAVARHGIGLIDHQNTPVIAVAVEPDLHIGDEIDILLQRRGAMFLDDAVAFACLHPGPEIPVDMGDRAVHASGQELKDHMVGAGIDLEREVGPENPA